MQHLWFRVIVVIVLTLSESELVLGQACVSEDLKDYEWGIYYPNIEATHSGTIVEYHINHTTTLSTVSTGLKYIDATLEDNVLRIFTTDAFANYEERETATQIQLLITIGCQSPPPIEFVFYQGLNADSNNHDPAFSQPFYEIPVKLPLHKGFDLTFYKEVSARDIDLRYNELSFRSPSSTFIDVGTSERVGDDKKTFYPTLKLNQQLLSLAEPYSFTIIATDRGLGESRNSTAQIIIVPDEEVTYIQSPRFQKAIYRGNISEDGVLSYEIPYIEEDSYTDALSFSLSGDDGDLFSVESAPPYSVFVSLKSPITEENVVGKTFLTAVISANHPEVFSGSTVLLIDLPTVPIITTPKPMFEKSLVSGSINSELELSIETIVLTASSYTDDITFTMIGDDSSTFSLTNEENLITITLTNPLSPEDVETKEFYSFVIVATNPNSGVGETAVLISLPPKICEECNTTTECPICPTQAPPTVDLSPTFQNQFYSFTIKSNEIGKIGDVLATSSNPDAVIGYTVASENAYLMTKLTIDSLTGELLLIDELNSGYYEAQVMAKITIDDEDLQKTCLVKLTVLAVVTCPDGNKTVEKSLAIQYLKENEIHRNIFSMKVDDCNYAIRSIQPDDKDYVVVNGDTNMLDTINFDREDPIFNEYEVPQIQIKLKLNCDDVTPATSQSEQRLPSFRNATQSVRSIDPSIGDGRWYALVNDIDFTSDLTVINIIIEDVNDNYPIFDPSTPSLVGYPEPAIANHIIPSHVVVIHATDVDAGINADIEYSIAESRHFQINSRNGIVTPLSDGWSNENSVQLTIYATDMNGADNGLRSSHVLNVKKLEEKHLTVVTLRDDNVNSTAEDVIEQLNAESSIKMMVLHSAIVPSLPVSLRQQSGGPLSVLKMIVYAFGNDGEPLETKLVQRQLEPFLSLRQLTFTSYEESLDSVTDDEENIVWMIVVGVMGGLILISVLTIFLMWWFKIRPYEYKTMAVETAVSQENLQDDFDQLKNESSPPMARFEAEKRESINISGTTEMESTDDSTKRVNTFLNLLEGDDELPEISNIDEIERRERKKSQGVTFNELVERIDIDTDPVRDSDIDLRS